MNEEKFLKENIVFDNEKQVKVLNEVIASLGLDKSVEIYKNLTKVIKSKIDFKTFFNFTYYDIELSEILFTLLRHQENHVKAFLSNVFNDCQIKIEARPSNYTKTKYYFKVPVDVGKTLDIRTYNYEVGPVDYYDMVKTLDFYDVNLILSHLPNHLIKRFSSNPDIISDLDKTRQLRNYVYHHNMLYSLGKEELKEAIILVLKNLPNEHLKGFYVDKINNLRFEGHDRKDDIGDSISIYINKYDEEEIYKY